MPKARFKNVAKLDLGELDAGTPNLATLFDDSFSLIGSTWFVEGFGVYLINIDTTGRVYAQMIAGGSEVSDIGYGFLRSEALRGKAYPVEVTVTPRRVTP